MIEKFKEIDRQEDFISILEAIVEGRLSMENICLHLLLDIGQKLGTEHSASVRYSKTTIDFWLIVQNLFQGKATRFFRGFNSTPSGKMIIFINEWLFNTEVNSSEA